MKTLAARLIAAGAVFCSAAAFALYMENSRAITAPAVSSAAKGACSYSPSQPKVAVIVHGVHPDMRDYKPLEAALSARGYAVLLYEYDSNQSLEVSADGLVKKFYEIHTAWPELCRVKVIAHSMGGLVARRAMTTQYAADWRNTGLRADLLTIATPFGGFRAANNARKMPLNIFGVKEYMRYMGSNSKFIAQPGPLLPVIRHFMVVTDETGALADVDGKTVSDSKVPPIAQENAEVESDPQLKGLKTLKAGHVGVLNSGGMVPDELTQVIAGFAD